MAKFATRHANPHPPQVHHLHVARQLLLTTSQQRRILRCALCQCPAFLSYCNNGAIKIGGPFSAGHGFDKPSADATACLLVQTVW